MLINNSDPHLIPNYRAFTMRGSNMSPAVNEGDLLVVDIDQNFIISGEVYVIEYKESTVVCRLLLDRETVTLLFDANKISFEEPVHAIKIIGRVIEIKHRESEQPI